MVTSGMMPVFKGLRANDAGHLSHPDGVGSCNIPWGACAFLGLSGNMFATYSSCSEKIKNHDERRPVRSFVSGDAFLNDLSAKWQMSGFTDMNLNH
jgi:hypothetical protein